MSGPKEEHLFKEIVAVEALTYEDPPDGGHLSIVDPYDGCTIGCPYCFQREDPSWSKPIVIKMNMPELLRVELADRPMPEAVYVGSRCDPYMPIEARYLLTRRCLGVLNEFRVPTYLCTKADPELVARDMDILRSFQAEATVALGLSNLSQIFESGSSDRTKNIEFAKRLHSMGVTVWAFIMPVLPGITDVHAMMRALPAEIPLWLFDLQMNANSRATPGFLNYIQRFYPDLAETYHEMVNSSYHVYYDRLRDELANDRRIRFPYG